MLIGNFYSLQNKYIFLLIFHLYNLIDQSTEWPITRDGQLRLIARSLISKKLWFSQWIRQSTALLSLYLYCLTPPEAVIVAHIHLPAAAAAPLPPSLCCTHSLLLAAPSSQFQSMLINNTLRKSDRDANHELINFDWSWLTILSHHPVLYIWNAVWWNLLSVRWTRTPDQWTGGPTLSSCSPQILNKRFHFINENEKMDK